MPCEIGKGTVLGWLLVGCLVAGWLLDRLLLACFSRNCLVFFMQNMH